MVGDVAACTRGGSGGVVVDGSSRWHGRIDPVIVIGCP